LVLEERCDTGQDVCVFDRGRKTGSDTSLMELVDTACVRVEQSAEDAEDGGRWNGAAVLPSGDGLLGTADRYRDLRSAQSGLLTGVAKCLAGQGDSRHGTPRFFACWRRPPELGTYISRTIRSVSCR
jgi:hypothetical protein